MSKLTNAQNTYITGSKLIRDDEISSEMQRNFYMNGFCTIDHKQYQWQQAFFDRVVAINSNIDNFELQSKNAGSLTLKNEICNNNLFFVDYLFDSGLLSICCSSVARPLYLTNYMHLLTPEVNSGLPWHRDTHLLNPTLTGNIPPVVKLIVYSSKVDENSGGFEILGKTHRLDLHNQYLDSLLSTINFNIYKFRGGVADCLLFDTSAIHRRARTNHQSNRSATIYGFATTEWQQEKYMTNHAPIIRHYNRRVNEEYCG